MAYNLKIKFYQNKTIQVTTYSKAVFIPQKVEDYTLDQDIDIDKLLNRYHELCELSFYDGNIDLLLELESVEKALKKLKVEPFRVHAYDDDVDELSISSDKHDENIRRAMRRTIQNICDYGRNNTWEWFYTFTFSPDMVKSREDFIDLSKKIRKWMNNQQRKSPNRKYLMVPELHSDGKSWHFHALGSGFNFDLQRAVNPHTGKILKDKKGRVIYNVKDFKLGHTTATRVTDTKKAVSYIIKYITKSLCTELEGKQKYYKSNNCTLPEENLLCVNSNEFEMIVKEIAESNGMKIGFRKMLKIDNDNYNNTITYYEME